MRKKRADFAQDMHLSGLNSAFLEGLYQTYIANPQSIDTSWRAYFESIKDEAGAQTQITYRRNIATNITNSGADVTSAKHNYRLYGHTAVALDPLEIQKNSPHLALLNTDSYDLDSLKRSYTSKIAAEFMHIENEDEISWIAEKLEKDFLSYKPSKDVRTKALKSLVETTTFEEFINSKFPGAKRFSIEGSDSFVAALDRIIEESAELGVRQCMIGMSHRGRLTTLNKVAGKPARAIFAEFAGNVELSDEAKALGASGDVKYHMGYSTSRMINDKSIEISIATNPSHLESINSVVLGQVRAKQDQNANPLSVLGVIVHGDSALSGQGSVMESLACNKLEAYSTHGAIHIVINNQLGFTANAAVTKPGRYCTEIAKSIGAPIFHVKCTDIDSIIFLCKLAAEFRTKFSKDIFIDIVGYRKYGHNEGDEPLFTQPQMYKVIHSLPRLYEVYADQLTTEDDFGKEQIERIRADFHAMLEDEFAESKILQKLNAQRSKEWTDYVFASDNKAKDFPTGVEISILKTLGKKLCTLPVDFQANIKIQRQLQSRLKAISENGDLDWAAGEALAFASLLNEGHNIRFSGQDVQRGTFSHRHAVLHDQQNGHTFVPLNHLSDDQTASIYIQNSNLSEFGVLAFEYGSSLVNPNNLTIWEAQFGDFANGAQVVIDQYVASAETKWLQSSGIVLLLPHGYEGQGPEHSSARLERFLQLCALDNMQILNCTTPASFFHAIRRQMKRNYRKPLIVMTPKSLLRHKLAVSKLDEMTINTSFLPILEDNLDHKGIKKVVLMSGKIYYDLLTRRQELQNDKVALIRLEQLYPFPEKELAKALSKYQALEEVIWCQEEHKNMGGYSFVGPLIDDLLQKIAQNSKGVKYVGRAPSASPATGYMSQHTKEQEEILQRIFK